MKVVFLFVDGLGIGKNDPEINPCAVDEQNIFKICREEQTAIVPFSGIAKGLDATMGLPGLPQSATGQTALLTGINASQTIQRHLSGFPNRALRELLLQHSVLLQASQMGKKAVFINAFRPLFFNLPEQMILRLSATTVANYAAGLPFFRLEDIVAKQSIYQDFTNAALRERGFDVPVYSPEEAADILSAAVAKYDFILYEYFRTDRAGHSQDMSLALAEIGKLNRFVVRFLGGIDLQETVTILTSDHGNIEDLSTKSHTRNPAMTLVWGAGNEEIAEKMHSIVDVTPAILDILRRK